MSPVASLHHRHALLLLLVAAATAAAGSGVNFRQPNRRLPPPQNQQQDGFSDPFFSPPPSFVQPAASPQVPEPPREADLVLKSVARPRNCQDALATVDQASTTVLCNPIRWIYDVNCPNNNPPYTNGTWIKVTVDTCAAAFLDPSFAKHKEFCTPTGTLYGLYGGQLTWTYPGYGFCRSLPYVLCPALKVCSIFFPVYNNANTNAPGGR